MYFKLIPTERRSIVTTKNRNLIYVKIYNNKDELLSTTVAYPTTNTYVFVFIVNSQLTLNCLNYLLKEKLAELDLNIITTAASIPWWDPNKLYNYYNMHLTARALLNVL